ncbi:hypothetical protein EBT25_12735 [bacterium]|nr:hypothetical protein [bacterium]
MFTFGVTQWVLKMEEQTQVWRSARQYKYVSTKEYHDAFPCAYRQWRADSHCNLIHGYSFSMKFYFGTDNLDVRNWAADYGGLKVLPINFTNMLTVSTFLICGAPAKQIVCGASVLRYARHRAIWLSAKVTVSGMKTCLPDLI